VRIGIIGSGNVGRTIADGALAAGHEVRLGARSPDKPELREWVDGAGDNASLTGIQEAAEFGELLVNTTDGDGSLDALRTAGAENLAGKTLLDVANAGSFDDRHNFILTYANDDSLAEEIQRAFPDLRVVKALSTMSRVLMTDPDALASPTTALICGDDETAKAEVLGLLGDFGWKQENVIDLGDLTAARAMEMFVALWVRLNSTLDRELFGVTIVRAQ
jgi:8-hydroxy-5-deazaflavin:NADPH oxidoreductase